MINALVNLGEGSCGEAKIETSGSMCELLSELTYLVVVLYQSMMRADREAARLFRESFCRALADPMVWNMPVHGPAGKDYCTVFKPPKF